MIRLDRKEKLAFDDVLLVPGFTHLSSRRDVDTVTEFLGNKLSLPIISSNMDTVTTFEMTKAMAESGGIGCLHRFWTPECNALEWEAFNVGGNKISTMVSVGIGEYELGRARTLLEAGANTFVIDVAHGAAMSVVQQAKALRELIGKNAYLVVGNFASAEGIREFLRHSGNIVDAFKVGIGGGSACTTRIVTGCGLPTFSSIVDCADVGYPIIADGGLRSSGDIAKALAAGATAVMLGGMLAGTFESPGELTTVDNGKLVKTYRGSASEASYDAQGKTAAWRAPEGASFEVPFVGSVASVMGKIEGGLRSAMTYVGATNLAEFRELANFAVVSTNGAAESRAHGSKTP